MNVMSSDQVGRVIVSAGSPVPQSPALLVTSDHASFCLLDELQSDGLRGLSHVELAVDTTVTVLFSPAMSIMASVTACESGYIALRFKHPVDVGEVLEDAASPPAEGRALRLPPIRVDRQVEVLRRGESIMVTMQDISPRAARLASSDLCPGDELTVCMGAQTGRRATVRWTQGGIAGIAFSPILPFAGLADWVVEEQFGKRGARTGHERHSQNRRGFSAVVRRLFVIDPDFRRRAAVCHALGGMPVHVEPFAEIAELSGFCMEGALALVHDEGDVVPEVIRWSELAGHWLPVIAYSEASRTASIVQAMKQGALDYLPWPFSPALVADRLESLLPEIEQEAEASRRKRDAIALLGRLTARERQILMEMINGHANRQIAEISGLSVRTVETHRANILRKIGANHSSEAIRLGMKAGLHRHCR
jgi:two-component system, LuxR family, response regulator FixJ